MPPAKRATTGAPYLRSRAQRLQDRRRTAVPAAPPRAWLERRDGTMEYFQVQFGGVVTVDTEVWTEWIAQPSEGRTVTVQDGDYLGSGPMEPGHRTKFLRVYRSPDVHARPRGA